MSWKYRIFRRQQNTTRKTRPVRGSVSVHELLEQLSSQSRFQLPTLQLHFRGRPNLIHEQEHRAARNRGRTGAPAHRAPLPPVLIVKGVIIPARTFAFSRSNGSSGNVQTNSVLVNELTKIK